MTPEAAQIAAEAVTTVAANAPEGESVLGALGVNWKLFVAQLLNFSVVLFVMWKWVYTPLLKAIETRSAKIEKGLKDAEAAAAARSGAEKSSEETIVAARKEAQRILEESQKAAETHRAEMKAKTQQELEALVQGGKDALAAEKERMVAAARAEVADLVVAVAEKAVGETLTPAQRKHLAESAAKHA